MTFYESLGVPRDATEYEIDAAFAKVKQQNDPNTSPDPKRAVERLKSALAAYRVLKDVRLRKEYDGRLKASEMPLENPEISEEEFRQWFHSGSVQESLASKVAHKRISEDRSSEESESFVWTPIVCLAVILVVAWAIYVFWAPHLDSWDAESEMPRRKRLESALLLVFPPANEYRVVPHAAHNVKVYIPESDFLRVPYPERKEVVSMLGKAWCGIDSPSDFYSFLPTVTILDIRAGKYLGAYSCTFESASIR